MLSLLAKVMDIHGENSFKSKSYSSAAFAIEKLAVPVGDLPLEKLSAIRGVGASSAQKIREITETGKLSILEEWIAKTPSGVIEMLNIKGIGPKKIHSIWKEMGIESVGELLYACKENRLKLYKGFGEKTQQNVIESINFYQQHKAHHLYAQVFPLIAPLQGFLEKLFPGKFTCLTGQAARQLETVESVDFVIAEEAGTVMKALSSVPEFKYEKTADDKLLFQTGTGLLLGVYACREDAFGLTSIRHSSSDEFFAALEGSLPSNIHATEEKLVFGQAGLPFIPAFLREDPSILSFAKTHSLPDIIQPADIRGIIHSHSNWSDGSQPIEEMAREAIGLGLEYLVISDHSKSAFYANGLSEERIREQHRQIDELNSRLAPFRIYKSIESDILYDGNLDYPDEVLASFDLVIASVHSNLKMTEEKAMARVLKAIENPYTRILGHPTGRLLLSRPGYPLNMDIIIDACAANGVVIELNANPSRLDIDWRFIRRLLDKGLLISINPDAHHTDGYADNLFGVMVAQKAMVTKENNLSSFTAAAFDAFIRSGRKPF